MDGFSRLCFWLELSTTNKKPEVVSYYYLKTCKKLKRIPCLLRTDLGSENVGVVALQEAFRSHHDDKFAGSKSIIQGKSTANQRIESFWGRMRQQCIGFYINLFKDLWAINFVNDSDEVELECFRYCFGSLIAYDLERFREEWNRHTIRKQKEKDVVSGKPNCMYYFPEKFNAENCKKDVSQDHIDICLEEYTIKPVFCDPLTPELVKLLLPNHEVPTTVEEALTLFEQIVSELKEFKENN